MIDTIWLADKHQDKLVKKTFVELHAGSGIVGDRYFNQKTHPGQNISFMEMESVERFNQQFAYEMDLRLPRRNVFTRGVPLNELLGKFFYVGELKFFGVELCEPCADFGEMLLSTTSEAGFTKAEAVRALTSRGGLRADVLSTGILRVGDHFVK